MDYMRRALVHSSADNTENNERLEYLGDSVLQLIASEYLFDCYPNLTEGQLSIRRAKYVCRANLVAVAQRMQLGLRLVLGRSELMDGGRNKPNILADAVEAQIGAMYLTYGIQTTRQWVVDNILARPTVA